MPQEFSYSEWQAARDRAYPFRVDYTKFHRTGVLKGLFTRNTVRFPDERSMDRWLGWAETEVDYISNIEVSRPA